MHGILVCTKLECRDKKSNLHYTGGIMPKCVAYNGLTDPSPQLSAWSTQLRRNVSAVANRWRHCVDLNDLGIEP